MDIAALLAVLGLSPEQAALVALVVPTVASLLAAVLPQPAEGSRWAPVRRILDILALNVGSAANRTVADRLAVAIAARAVDAERLAHPAATALPSPAPVAAAPAARGNA
jgi:hypothetical protein